MKQKRKYTTHNKSVNTNFFELMLARKHTANQLPMYAHWHTLNITRASCTAYSRQGGVCLALSRYWWINLITHSKIAHSLCCFSTKLIQAAVGFFPYLAAACICFNRFFVSIRSIRAYRRLRSLRRNAVNSIFYFFSSFMFIYVTYDVKIAQESYWPLPLLLVFFFIALFFSSNKQFWIVDACVLFVSKCMTVHVLEYMRWWSWTTLSSSENDCVSVFPLPLPHLRVKFVHWIHVCSSLHLDSV